MALPELHALTGCDSTIFIHGIGKEKAYKIFEQNEVYTDALSLLGEFEVVPPNVIDLLEQFVCHLYNFLYVSPEDKYINEVRYKRFISRTKKKINPETLPPTKDECFLHLKRSNYTALIMKSAFQLHPVTLLPQDHGWLLKDGKLEVQWMNQPFIPPSLREITSCKCKKGRCGNRRCKCVNVGLLCSDVCNCIDCENHERESNDKNTLDSEIEFSDSNSD